MVKTDIGYPGNPLPVQLRLQRCLKADLFYYFYQFTLSLPLFRLCAAHICKGLATSYKYDL